MREKIKRGKKRWEKKTEKTNSDFNEIYRELRDSKSRRDIPISARLIVVIRF